MVEKVNGTATAGLQLLYSTVRPRNSELKKSNKFNLKKNEDAMIKQSCTNFFIWWHYSNFL
jgi:hypothetical protein